MEVILLEKIGKLGNIGDKAKVKAGFGRNYLIPQGKAVFATESNIAEFESRRAELEAKAADALTAAQARADQLAALDSIVISVIAGDEGKLFGSIGARELEDAIGGAGVEVSKNEISLPDGALRQTGDYVIDIQLHSDVTASVSVTLEAE
jgi:large subunit ribosomal protein L9